MAPELTTKHVILAGSQGCGKGTQAKKIAEKYGLTILETGGKIREICAETELPTEETPEEEFTTNQKIKIASESGKLAPDEVIMEMVREMLGQIENAGILFDGMPRTPEQAVQLKTLLEGFGQKCQVVLIEISKEETMNRLQTRKICIDCRQSPAPNHKEDNCTCGGELTSRVDDRETEGIETRLKEYQTKTVPAINEFDDIIRIKGEQTPEKVSKDIREALDPIFKQVT